MLAGRSSINVACVGTRRLSTLAKHALLYVDRGLLLVNKPSGLVCQYNRKDDREQNAHSDFNDFTDDLKRQLSLDADLLPLHRLDKATTGALAFALTHSHAQDLAEQFNAHTVKKSYLAIVRGGTASFPNRTGNIRGVLYTTNGRVSSEAQGQWEKRAITETDWEVLASSPVAPLSLVRLSPFTGHKHQLRVHMAKVLKGKLTRYLPEGPNKRLRMTFGASLPRYFVRLCDRIKIPLSSELIHGGLWIEGKRMPIGKGGRTPTADATSPTSSDVYPETRAEDGNVDDILTALGGRWLGPGTASSKPTSSPPRTPRS
ncbi:hypothetical protein IEO21_03753 [Rhodonia placenta]|uniref:Pseudouridine synthase RsuA/RluA-like domain-containing protein n=1 Tax=Rhodonia placenta TaxID=104341 RepID=A0A8H7U389_9APHY|nr:hypothetical protein IEO21_03753 [Postia placenta]